jgi:hypothetical protein
MANKCPAGVICIENMTLFLIIVIILLILYLGYYSIIKFININNRSTSNSSNRYTVNIGDNDGNSNSQKSGLYPRPGYSFSNIENDVLLNPYQAPLRDNRIFPNLGDYLNLRNRVPINVPTQSYDTNYRQVGILTRTSGDKETILPLMGKPLITNRDKWNFYAMSENNNMLKLPISTLRSGSSSYTKCMGQNGCNDLYTGDTVKVDGYNDSFNVTTYENDTPRYIPYL